MCIRDRQYTVPIAQAGQTNVSKKRRKSFDNTIYSVVNSPEYIPRFSTYGHQSQILVSSVMKCEQTFWVELKTNNNINILQNRAHASQT